MHISEVESITGLTKKSIRYYEKYGLLKPTRNINNDYRIYDKDDIEKLKRIKIMRELGVSIRDIYLLDNQNLSLRECMEDRIKKIAYEENNLKKVRELCENLARENLDFKDIDNDKNLKIINTLGKEGFTMRDMHSNKSRKIWGAIISSLTFSIFFILLSGVITYFQITESEKLPVIFYLILIFILLTPVLAITFNLIERIKEILGGEEDEASKY